mmetsp:Transcript_24156/g.49494  ORF Transcript_24156/g.49494 Transcript_24156/m.49494 type:complete len:218 (-) Transcript_24156:449-1102(-)
MFLTPCNRLFPTALFRFAWAPTHTSTSWPGSGRVRPTSPAPSTTASTSLSGRQSLTAATLSLSMVLEALRLRPLPSLVLATWSPTRTAKRRSLRRRKETAATTTAALRLAPRFIGCREATATGGSTCRAPCCGNCFARSSGEGQVQDLWGAVTLVKEEEEEMARTAAVSGKTRGTGSTKTRRSAPPHSSRPKCWATFGRRGCTTGLAGRRGRGASQT